MNFNEYQELARKTAIYPNVGNNLWYPGLGITGEAGEVADKIKKIYRDDNGYATQPRREELIKELGDVLWYISNIASELGYHLEFVATTNIDKLSNRVKNNTVHGSGDNR